MNFFDKLAIGIFIAVLLIIFGSRVEANELYVERPRPDVFILGETIGLQQESYRTLLYALNSARSGQVITIVLRFNNGGYVRDEHRIIYAMKNSRALVVTEVQGWASSAALGILLSGDRIRLQKGRATGIAHLSSPRSPSSIANDIREMQYYRKFLNNREWFRVTQGEDVQVYGSAICARSNLVKVTETNTFCIIKNRR